jgi:hypothetical protein
MNRNVSLCPLNKTEVDHIAQNGERTQLGGKWRLRTKNTPLLCAAVPKSDSVVDKARSMEVGWQGFGLSYVILIPQHLYFFFIRDFHSYMYIQ